MPETMPLTGDAAARSMLALRRYAHAVDPDQVFLDDLSERIERARLAPVPSRAGPPARILLLSYAGAGNTGADLRTIETIVQLRSLLRSPAPRIDLLALGNLFDHPVLAAVPKLDVALPYVPDALAVAATQYDWVLNVEGSTYTSKFSDSLAGMLLGGVALAAAHGRQAFAYGVDSGAMSTPLSAFARGSAAGVRVFARNGAAREQLAQLGIDAQLGADSAWHYGVVRTTRVASLPTNYAALCPNNPFWWPVVPDGARARALDARGEASPLRYGMLHFHTWSDGREAAYRRYVARYASIARALRRYGHPPVLVAMERLDLSACRDVAAQLDFDVPIVARGIDMLDDVAGAVGHASRVVTTRYHAAVLAIASRVPVFGLSMDERINRLLDEAGLGEWAGSCAAEDGANRAIEHLCGAACDGALRGAYDALVARERARFDWMGAQLSAAAQG
jgi:polysaccharide pyruvyl transferase WcaK-like protein